MEESQTKKLYNLLSDGQPHSTVEIMERVYGNDHLGLARVGARIHDIKHKYGVEIEGHKDQANPSIYWYHLKLEKPVIMNLTDALLAFRKIRPNWSEDYKQAMKMEHELLNERIKDYAREQCAKMFIELINRLYEPNHNTKKV